MTVPYSLVYNLEVNTHYGLFTHYELFIHYMSSSFHYSRGTLHICMHTFSLKSIGEIKTQCGSDMMSFSCN